MAYLVRIGAIPQNKSGIGSRGYVVRRRGTTVLVEFGKIEAIDDQGTKFFWVRVPKPRVFRFRSVDAARAKVRSLVEAQLRPRSGGGYHRLPQGVRILRPRSE